MPDFTTNQWVILALVLVLGWFLGLLTMAGGRRWRREFEREREMRIAADSEADRLAARINELEGESERRVALEQERETHIARAAAANDRIAELERRRAPIDAGTAAGISAAASGERDDLSRIFGVGRGGEIKLNEFGLYRYADIIALSPQDEAGLEARLGLSAGTIDDERWREQAEMLRKGELDEHARRFA